ncbi:MAG: filamentous hemagglutinin N-terminal domain-containing protein, partial [Proteobacteria bacterium]|nr:filamentous hemagglutinin N-terminal domain-containing protein [Pseudomonadota bacterium]
MVNMRTLINTLLVVGMSVFIPGLACATPTGGTVVGGAASISQSGNTTTINQTSQNAVINWQSFNTNQNETAQFIQPNASSAALNRIMNGLPTTFEGQLLANGRVFIVNPNGILFTGTSSINVGSLFATTANIKDSDFMNGTYHFQQDPNNFSSVINNGYINAHGDSSIGEQGLVALVAPGVQNNGVITANMGKVVLGSGTSYTVDFYGDNLINFDVGSDVSQKPHDTNGNAMNELVSNNGQIYANGGKVILTARAASNVVDNVISMGGYIEAKSAAVGKNGVIILGGNNGIVKVTGKINVAGKSPGQKGGTVKVLGYQVGLFDQASIDASGDIAGGEVLIGGNTQGLGPEPNAEATYVGPNTLINAGLNGKVVIWGTDSMRAYGEIDAPNGHVETSGHWLDVSGIRVYAGMWLIDPPSDITIIAGSGQSGIQSGTFQSDGSQQTATIGADLISNTLNAGTSLTVNTIGTPDFPGVNTGSISINASISKTSAAGQDPTLAFTAAGSIFLNAPISAPAGPLEVYMFALSSIILSSSINTNPSGGVGNVTMQALQIAQSSSAPITAHTLTATANDGILLDAALNGVNNFNGTVTFFGDINFLNNGALTITGINQANGFNFNITNNGSLNQTGPIIVSGSSNISTFNSYPVDFETNGGSNKFPGPISFATTQASLYNSVATQLNTSSVNGTLSIDSGGSITQTGTITATALALFPAAANSDILLASFPNNFGGNVEIIAPQNVRDLAIRDVSTAATLPTPLPFFSSLSNLRNFTLIFDNATTTLNVPDLSFAALTLKDVDFEL